MSAQRQDDVSGGPGNSVGKMLRQLTLASVGLSDITDLDSQSLGLLAELDGFAAKRVDAYGRSGGLVNDLGRDFSSVLDGVEDRYLACVTDERLGVDVGGPRTPSDLGPWSKLLDAIHLILFDEEEEGDFVTGHRGLRISRREVNAAVGRLASAGIAPVNVLPRQGRTSGAFLKDPNASLKASEQESIGTKTASLFFGSLSSAFESISSSNVVTSAGASSQKPFSGILRNQPPVAASTSTGRRVATAASLFGGASALSSHSGSLFYPGFLGTQTEGHGSRDSLRNSPLRSDLPPMLGSLRAMSPAVSIDAGEALSRKSHPRVLEVDGALGTATLLRGERRERDVEPLRWIHSGTESLEVLSSVLERVVPGSVLALSGKDSLSHVRASFSEQQRREYLTGNSSVVFSERPPQDVASSTAIGGQGRRAGGANQGIVRLAPRRLGRALSRLDWSLSPEDHFSVGGNSLEALPVRSRLAEFSSAQSAFGALAQSLNDTPFFKALNILQRPKGSLGAERFSGLGENRKGLGFKFEDVLSGLLSEAPTLMYQGQSAEQLRELLQNFNETREESSLKDFSLRTLGHDLSSLARTSEFTSQPDQENSSYATEKSASLPHFESLAEPFEALNKASVSLHLRALLSKAVQRIGFGSSIGKSVLLDNLDSYTDSIAEEFVGLHRSFASQTRDELASPQQEKLSLPYDISGLDVPAIGANLDRVRSFDASFASMPSYERELLGGYGEQQEGSDFSFTGKTSGHKSDRMHESLSLGLHRRVGIQGSKRQRKEAPAILSDMQIEQGFFEALKGALVHIDKERSQRGTIAKSSLLSALQREKVLGKLSEMTSLLDLGTTEVRQLRAGFSKASSSTAGGGEQGRLAWLGDEPVSISLSNPRGVSKLSAFTVRDFKDRPEYLTALENSNALVVPLEEIVTLKASRTRQKSMSSSLAGHLRKTVGFRKSIDLLSEQLVSEGGVGSLKELQRLVFEEGQLLLSQSGREADLSIEFADQQLSLVKEQAGERDFNVNANTLSEEQRNLLTVEDVTRKSPLSAVLERRVQAHNQSGKYLQSEKALAPMEVDFSVVRRSLPVDEQLSFSSHASLRRSQEYSSNQWQESSIDESSRHGVSQLDRVLSLANESELPLQAFVSLSDGALTRSDDFSPTSLKTGRFQDRVDSEISAAMGEKSLRKAISDPREQSVKHFLGDFSERGLLGFDVRVLTHLISSPSADKTFLKRASEYQSSLVELLSLPNDQLDLGEAAIDSLASDLVLGSRKSIRGKNTEQPLYYDLSSADSHLVQADQRPGKSDEFRQGSEFLGGLVQRLGDAIVGVRGQSSTQKESRSYFRKLVPSEFSETGPLRLLNNAFKGELRFREDSEQTLSLDGNQSYRMVHPEKISRNLREIAPDAGTLAEQAYRLMRSKAQKQDQLYNKSRPLEDRVIVGTPGEVSRKEDHFVPASASAPRLMQRKAIPLLRKFGAEESIIDGLGAISVSQQLEQVGEMLTQKEQVGPSYEDFKESAFASLDSAESLYYLPQTKVTESEVRQDVFLDKVESMLDRAQALSEKRMSFALPSELAALVRAGVKTEAEDQGLPAWKRRKEHFQGVELTELKDLLRQAGATPTQGAQRVVTPSLVNPYPSFEDSAGADPLFRGEVSGSETKPSNEVQSREQSFAASDSGVPPYEELMMIAEEVYRRIMEKLRDELHRRKSQ